MFEHNVELVGLEQTNLLQQQLISRWCEANGKTDLEKGAELWISDYSAWFREIIAKYPNYSLSEIEHFLYDSIETKEAV